MYSDRLVFNESKAINLIFNADKNTPIIIDFDETLLLRNSTAEYLNSLQPRLLGFILIAIIKIIRPWKWLTLLGEGNKTKDWFLVMIPTLLMPWTFFLWRKKAQQLAQAYGNSELITAINNNSEAPIIFASLGFKFIITPILKNLPLKCLAEKQHHEFDLIACRFWQGAKDRNLGKLAMIKETLSESEIVSAIVITDSQDDLPLLQIVQYPCLVIWSQAKYINPFQDFWLLSLINTFRNYSHSN